MADDEGLPPRAFLIVVIGWVVGASVVLWLASCTPAQALTLDRVSLQLVADSLHVRAPLTLPAGADSAQVTITVTPGGARTVRAVPPAVAVTAAFLAPAEGETVTVQACGIAWRRGVVGPESCNQAQQWTRPVTPPGPILWPDTMDISAMHWPDAASLALVEAAWGDALPFGPIVAVTWRDTLALGEWARWGQAYLVRPASGCSASCRQYLLSDTAPFSLARRTWAEVRGEAWRFATTPTYRDWWQRVKAGDA